MTSAKTMTDRLCENLGVLECQAPELAQAIAIAPEGGVEVRPARDGTPILAAGGMALHNLHSPRSEARRWAGGHVDAAARMHADSLVVLGFGAGHHLEALVANWSRRIVVIEPNLAVLRAALATLDLREVLARIDLRCSVPRREEMDSFGVVSVLPFSPALASDRSGFRSILRTVQGRVGVRQLRLKILVVSPMVGGTLPMTHYAARALATLGHAVTVLDMSPFCAGFKQIPAFGATGARRQALEAHFIDFMAEGVLRRVEYEQPDLVLAMALAPMTTGLLDRFARDGVKTALWFLEDFRRFEYWQDEGPHYRYVFSIQRDACFDAFKDAGIVSPAYLPCAADPNVHMPLRLSDAERAKFGSPVSFVGAGFRNRRVTFRRLVDLDFKIWGNDWTGAEGLGSRTVAAAGTRISTDDCVRVFNASDINLNLHSSTYVDGVDPIGDYVNPRTFEIAACGGFQLVDERRYMPELFEPGREIVTFGSPEELRDSLLHYLAHPQERNAIAAASRARVLAQHTYEARMSDFLEEIFGRDYEHFMARRAHTHGTQALINAAGPETALGQYLLRTCADLPDVNLDDLGRSVHVGEGPLREEEEIVLFLKQYDDMFLTAYRP